jgi:hypothetical protein
VNGFTARPKSLFQDRQPLIVYSTGWAKKLNKTLPLVASLRPSSSVAAGGPHESRLWHQPRTGLFHSREPTRARPENAGKILEEVLRVVQQAPVGEVDPGDRSASANRARSCLQRLGGRGAWE